MIDVQRRIEAPQMDFGQVILQEQARRNQVENSNLEKTPTRKIFDKLISNPTSLTENKKIFKEACESLLWIKEKNRGVNKWKFNLSQRILLDAFFEMKAETPAVRINVLKGRQQGMSTAIGGFSIIEMLSHPGTTALISSEKKGPGGSGENIYFMYERYLQEFVNTMHAEVDEPNWLFPDKIEERARHGEQFMLFNGSDFYVVSQGLVTSKTVQFVHLSEAAFFNDLSTYMGMLMQTVPKLTESYVFIESTAKAYGNHHYDEWMAACDGKSAFRPLFLPWYCHEEYRVEFDNDEDKDKFRKSLGDSDDHHYGNEHELLTLNTEGSKWREHWKTLNFEDQDQVSLENLRWRRIVIDELKGVIPEFNRQYPTTPEMAFLSNTDHVLDMSSVRWYSGFKVEDEPMVREPERGEFTEPQIEPRVQTGPVTEVSVAKYIRIPTGVVHMWEGPLPNNEYVIGVDPAEGRDAGDYAVACVMRRYPFKVVCRLRGYQGRMLTLRDFARQTFWLGKHYNDAYILTELNGVGTMFPDFLMEWGYPSIMSEGMALRGPDTGKWGWVTTGPLRSRAISLLQDTVNSRQVGIPDPLLLEEMNHFMWIDGKAQAARKGRSGSENSTRDVAGGHDDCLTAFMGALLANEALPAAKTEEQIKSENMARETIRNKRAEKRRSPDGYSPWDYC